ncbi:glycerophosphodiester phosphodiesterase [Ignisphaera sp. 4213-co]|uniref:Glycerophosphodiester phosphodiesterase n=1 Tax=Ignisphaera cupida TaxID=3050454 RepID=A0ABD4Z813_9CREN|nr:glycerophosphodiester phosphodiesterase [Ignisphaera sp. 4213-co]MDK6029486.1 glycerophosphodiester phosphodiesterase [Ignisphaera sp. 4213-co]
MIIAHRGASAYAPENTLKSFRKALEMHADAIEFDIRRTFDNIPVVVHDEDLKRVANINKKVSELTLEELKRIKVFGEENIPTFEEVLQEFGNKILMFIEIKDEGLEEAVVSLISKYNIKDNCLVISFNYNILRKIKSLDSKLEIGLLTYSHSMPIDIALKSKAFAILPRFNTITPRIVKEIHSKNLKVYTWTINDVSTALKVIGFGVDGIATDDPHIKNSISKQVTLQKFFD